LLHQEIQQNKEVQLQYILLQQLITQVRQQQLAEQQLCLRLGIQLLLTIQQEVLIQHLQRLGILLKQGTQQLRIQRQQRIILAQVH